MCLSCKFFKFSKAGEVSCSISCHVCRGRHPRKCCCNWTRNRWERGGLVADSGDDPQTEGICKNRFYGILWCAGVVQVVPDVGGLEVVQTAETFFSTNAQSCSSRWFQYFKYNYKLHLQTFAKTVVKDGWNPNHAQLEVSGNFLRGVFFFFGAKNSEGRLSGPLRLWAVNEAPVFRLLTVIPSRSCWNSRFQALCIRPERLF